MSGVKMKARDEQIGGDHYKNMGVEPWDVVDTWPLEQRIGYYRGGALKYIMRMGTKDESAMEIRKGAHYLRKLAEVLDEERTGNDDNGEGHTRIFGSLVELHEAGYRLVLQGDSDVITAILRGIPVFVKRKGDNA